MAASSGTWPIPFRCFRPSWNVLAISSAVLHERKRLDIYISTCDKGAPPSAGTQCLFETWCLLGIQADYTRHINKTGGYSRETYITILKHLGGLLAHLPFWRARSHSWVLYYSLNKIALVVYFIHSQRWHNTSYGIWNPVLVCVVQWLTSSGCPLCNVISNCPQSRLPETLDQVFISTCRSINQPFSNDGCCDTLRSLLDVTLLDDVNLHSILIM